MVDGITQVQVAHGAVDNGVSVATDYENGCVGCNTPKGLYSEIMHSIRDGAISTLRLSVEGSHVIFPSLYPFYIFDPMVDDDDRSTHAPNSYRRLMSDRPMMMIDDGRRSTMLIDDRRSMIDDD